MIINCSFVDRYGSTSVTVVSVVNLNSKVVLTALFTHILTFTRLISSYPKQLYH